MHTPVRYSLYITFAIILAASISCRQAAGNHDSDQPEGMVWIPGGTFMMGGDNDQAYQDEFPKHKVSVSGFWMDETVVTNAQFRVLC
jgi:formylglycine-generating enzyme required for sulfatase activity